MNRNVIYIAGEIGKEVTLEKVQAQYNPGADVVTVYIDSPGGEVNEGKAIRSFLMNIPQEHETVITGMCYSIAKMVNRLESARQVIVLRRRPIARRVGLGTSNRRPSFVVPPRIPPWSTWPTT